jgi:hypothetical protein
MPLKYYFQMQSFFLYFRTENILEIEECRSTNEERLSPVQCVVYRPEPTNVERDNTNGRLLRIFVITL